MNYIIRGCILLFVGGRYRSHTYMISYVANNLFRSLVSMTTLYGIRSLSATDCIHIDSNRMMFQKS